MHCATHHPMILSHDHKFIYIKTYKTGSNSIEAALSGICGPGDVITEASEQLRGVRQKPAQNFRLDHPAVPKRPLWRRLLGRPERHYHPSVGFFEHMPASMIRIYVGESIWRSYFKFSFERNPWDRQVSWYQHKMKSRAGGTRPSFDAFNSDRRRAWVENWDLYAIDGNIAVDFVGRYETLAEDFAMVAGRLGLTGQVAVPAVSVSHDYRAHYNDQSRHLIASWYAPEIREFGYEF
ncbi:MAG: sulfotransferase family 2 domain-containing protein [Hyphomicrobiaceae bacterium]